MAITKAEKDARVAKRRAKNRAVAASQDKGEPTVDKENLQLSLQYALNYYSANTSSKDQKSYAIAYFKKRDKDVAALLNKVPDYRFITFGTLCRMMDREVYDKDWHGDDNWFDRRFAELLETANRISSTEVEDDTPNTPVLSIQDHILNKARALAGEIDGAIDDFVSDDTDFDVSSYLQVNDVNSQVAKRIGDMYVKDREEISEVIAGTDDQLNEAYSHLTKPKLKKLLKFYDTIVDACNKQVQVAKVARKPRARKPKAPAKIIAKLKYMKEFADLNMKSVVPTKILESNELWVYNTKLRKLTVYKAVAGVLNVKGTSIIGFDTDNSSTMKLRKPEEFFKGLSIGKRALNSAFKKLKTKPSVPNGRVNADCIILGAF